MGFVVNNSLNQLSDDDTSLPTSCSYSYVENIIDKYAHRISDSIKMQLQRRKLTNDVINSYKFSLQLLRFSESELNLVITKMFNGNKLCVVLCYKENTTSISINNNEYVLLPTQLNNYDPNQNPSRCIQNTKKLAYAIRSNVIIPIRTAIMFDEKYTFAGLIGVPKETLWYILKFLDLQSLQSLSQTCSKLRSDVISYVNEMKLKITNERRSTTIIHAPKTERRGYWGEYERL